MRTLGCDRSITKNSYLKLTEWLGGKRPSDKA
jgi:hypothetical protein